MRANQLRLWFAAFAYVVMAALRRIGLAGTELARATCGSIRLKLLKIGVLITKSVRRVQIAFASSCSRSSPAPQHQKQGTSSGLQNPPPAVTAACGLHQPVSRHRQTRQEPLSIMRRSG